jgi:hypothetical protein
VNRETSLLRGFLAQLVQGFGHEEIHLGLAKGLGVLTEHRTNERRKGERRRQNDHRRRKRRCRHETQEKVQKLALSGRRNIFSERCPLLFRLSLHPSIHPDETSSPF